MNADVNWLIFALGALALAVAFTTGLGVPRERPDGLVGLILRWGHGLVWFLLVGVFLAFDRGLEGVAQLLGLLALGGYIVFLGALVMVKRDPTHAATWQHIAVRLAPEVPGPPDEPDLSLFIETATVRYQPKMWGRVKAGQRLWLLVRNQAADAAIVAEATVDRVQQIKDCTRTQLLELTSGSALHDAPAFWEWRVAQGDSMFEHMSAVVVWTRSQRTLNAPFRPDASGLSDGDRQSLLGTWIVVDSPELAATWLPPGSWVPRRAN